MRPSGTTAREAARSTAAPLSERERVAAKLAERYPPPRFPRRALVGIVAVLAAVLLGWTLWTAWLHAEPDVSGQVPRFSFPADTTAAVTLTVQRRDPSRSATCQVIVQAANHAVVGRKDIAVPGSTAAVVDVTDTIRTLQRGTSVSVSECQLDR